MGVVGNSGQTLQFVGAVHAASVSTPRSNPPPSSDSPLFSSTCSSLPPVVGRSNPGVTLPARVKRIPNSRLTPRILRPPCRSAVADRPRAIAGTTRLLTLRGNGLTRWDSSLRVSLGGRVCQVEENPATSPWVLVLQQRAGAGALTSLGKQGVAAFNASALQAYADALEAHRDPAQGGFTFRLSWPTMRRPAPYGAAARIAVDGVEEQGFSNVWRQRSNPVNSTAVRGYSEIDVAFRSGGWRGACSPFRVSVCAARTLNATGQCRVDLSPRSQRLRAACWPRQRGLKSAKRNQIKSDPEKSNQIPKRCRSQACAGPPRRAT